MRSEMAGWLAGAVANLGEQERQVLALHYCEELTMKKVGVLLGIGESGVPDSFFGVGAFACA